MKSKLFKCSICGKEFQTKEELADHMNLVHKGGKQHMCG